MKNLEEMLLLKDEKGKSNGTNRPDFNRSPRPGFARGGQNNRPNLTEKSERHN